MEEKIKAIVEQYFALSQIEEIKLLGKRLIVVLGVDKDEPEKQQALQAQLQKIEGIDKVSVVFTALKKTQTLRPEIAPWQVKGVKKIIVVASGKGGVGKSTTAVNLTLALANLGLKTAIFDADIYGPSIPTMLGYEGVAPQSEDGKTFVPFDFMGTQSMSIGTLIDKSTPLIWRGAKACGAIEQLLCDTLWKNVDVMVIDMPPGTGDIQITLSQRLHFDGAVIVSTPQDIALIDAVKGVNMFKKVNVPILGIIENMSYYICEKCGHRADIFGHEGARKTAEKLGETFLGEIPLHLDIRENADNGTPIVFAQPESPHTKAYEEIAAKVAKTLGLV